MAAAGYMTELDTESIWKADLTTARFTKINVRIGEILNLWVNEDAAVDVTNTKVLPLLEQISEQTLFELIAVSKTVGVPNPWDFINTNLTNIATKMILRNEKLLKKVGIILQKRHNIKQTSKLTLPSHSD